MSVKHIGLVLDHLQVKPATKLVAIVLADHADSDGICWPSHQRIAMRTGLDKSTVKRHLAKLVEMGVVHKLRTGSIYRDGDKVVRVTNAYRLDAEALIRSSQLSTDALCIGVQPAPLEGFTAAPHRGVPLHPKPSLNHQKNNRQHSQPVDIEQADLGSILRLVAGES